MFLLDSTDSPAFPESYFVILRDILSRSVVTRSTFIVVELQVGSIGILYYNFHFGKVDKEKLFHYRVFTHRGSLEQIEKGIGTKECRYARTIRDAKAIYGSLVREKAFFIKYPCVDNLVIRLHLPTNLKRFYYHQLVWAH